MKKSIFPFPLQPSPLSPCYKLKRTFWSQFGRTGRASDYAATVASPALISDCAKKSILSLFAKLPPRKASAHHCPSRNGLDLRDVLRPRRPKPLLSILLHFAFTTVFIPNRQDIHLHIFFAVFFLLLLLVSLFLLSLLLLLYSIVIEARSVPLHTNSPQPLIPFLYSKPRPHLWECWLRNNQPLTTWSQMRSHLRVFVRVWGKYFLKTFQMI